MTATKTKNDTTSVTASIMAVDVDKKKELKHAPLLNPSLSDLKKAGLVGMKPAAKANPKASPAPAKAEDKGAKNAAEKAAEKAEMAVTMSTDVFSKEVLTELQRRTKAIKNSIGKIDSSFETIAFNLHWIYTKQAFKAEGYPNIESFCSEVFGYEKSTCYSLIGVVDRFAKRDEKGALTEAFDERVKGYSVSKLSLMCNLTDAEIDSLKPSMSVRDIKKFVKGLMGKALPELSEGDGESEEEDSGDNGAEDSGVIDVEAKVVSDVLIKCKGKDDFDKKAGKINEYVARVFKQHPDAVIEVSYSLPQGKEKKA
ncbi:MAG: hypothetical protein OSJ59_06200 [Lachnospiraceae bacterium]|nr:hypothetical protein [Lachnospiraceae bacterium]